MTSTSLPSASSNPLLLRMFATSHSPLSPLSPFVYSNTFVVELPPSPSSIPGAVCSLLLLPTDIARHRTLGISWVIQACHWMDSHSPVEHQK